MWFPIAMMMKPNNPIVPVEQWQITWNFTDYVFWNVDMDAWWTTDWTICYFFWWQQNQVTINTSAIYYWNWWWTGTYAWLPIATAWPSATYINWKIYVIWWFYYQSFVFWGYRNNVQIFNTNTWAWISQWLVKPTASARHRSVAVGDNIYCLWWSNWWTLSINQVYNTITNIWSTLAPMPKLFRWFVACYYWWYIYVLWNTTESWTPAAVYKYNISLDSWSTVDYWNWPSIVDQYSVFWWLLNGRIYYWRPNLLWEYNIWTNQWTQKTPPNCAQVNWFTYTNNKLIVVSWWPIDTVVNEYTY